MSEAKNRVAAALPPDATPKLVALGLPQDVAAAVAAAARSKPAAEVRALIADLKRNDALRGRVATGALSPSALLELGADDRCREDRKRKAPPPVVEEDDDGEDEDDAEADGADRHEPDPYEDEASKSP